MAVVKLLLDHVKNVLSSSRKKQEKQCKVLKDLRINGRESKFIETVGEGTMENSSQLHTSYQFIAHTTSVRQKGSRRSRACYEAYKPFVTLADIFRQPKDRPSDAQIEGVVYKVEYKACCFTYIGESKRSWSSRWLNTNQIQDERTKSAVKDYFQRTGAI